MTEKIEERLAKIEKPIWGGYANGDTDRAFHIRKCKYLSETLLLVADQLEGKIAMSEAQARSVFENGLKLLMNDNEMMKISNFFKTENFE